MSPLLICRPPAHSHDALRLIVVLIVMVKEQLLKNRDVLEVPLCGDTE